MKLYAGMGSRSTPSDALVFIEELAYLMAKRGYGLRSGGAQGADMAFERGCDRAGGLKAIWLPWSGFNNRVPENHSVAVGSQLEAYKQASKFHFTWNHLKTSVRAMHARTEHILCGSRIITPRYVDFLITWTPLGLDTGGAGQAIRSATAKGIPVFNLGDPSKRYPEMIEEWIEEHHKEEEPWESVSESQTAVWV